MRAQIEAAGDKRTGHLRTSFCIGDYDGPEYASIPVLSIEQERELAEDLFYNDNLDAARQLVMSRLRFVAHIARSYNGYGLSEADLIQEGNVGLMKAIKHFDPERGVRLVSFAVHWIMADIHEYILRNWRIVKVATTKAQRKHFPRRCQWIAGSRPRCLRHPRPENTPR